MQILEAKRTVLHSLSLIICLLKFRNFFRIVNAIVMQSYDNVCYRYFSFRKIKRFSRLLLPLRRELKSIFCPRCYGDLAYSLNELIGRP